MLRFISRYRKYHNISCGVYKKNTYVMPYKYFMPRPEIITKSNDVNTLVKEEYEQHQQSNIDEDEDVDKAIVNHEKELNEALENVRSIDDIADVFVNHYEKERTEEERIAYITSRIESRHVDPLTPAELREASWYADKLLEKYSIDEKDAEPMVHGLLKPKISHQKIDYIKLLPLDMNVFFKQFEKNLDNYNLLLQVHAYEGTISSARQVLNQMKIEGFVPNANSYVALIHVAGRLRQMTVAFNIFNEMERENILPNQSVFAALIYASVRKPSFVKAYEVFDMVKEREMRTTEEMYYALIKGLYDKRHYKRADEVYVDMFKDNIEPTAPTIELMMKVAGKLQLPERARVHETQMHALTEPIEMDLPLFNAMIFAHASRPDTYHEAFQYFDRLIHLSFVPNHQTFHNLLYACEVNNDLSTADTVMKMMSKFELTPTMETKICLLKVIASSQRFVQQEVNGKVLSQTDRIQLALDLLEETDKQDININFLNCILSCYTKPCHIQSALKFFHETYTHYNIQPNFTTYSHLFRMATKSKRVLLANYLREMMKTDKFTLSLGQYRQLLYLYGKMGQFKSAELLIEEMKQRDLLKKLPENERLFALGEPVILSELYDKPSPRLRATKIVSNMPLLPPRNRKKRSEAKFAFIDKTNDNN